MIAMEGVEPNNDATSLLVKEEEEPSNVTEVKAQAPTNQDRIIYSAQVFNIKDKLSLEKLLPQDNLICLSCFFASRVDHTPAALTILFCSMLGRTL